MSKTAISPIVPPRQVFTSGMQFLFMRGGSPLTSRDLDCLNAFLDSTSEDCFVIVENMGSTGLSPQHKYIFPKGISWEIFTSGGETTIPLSVFLDRDLFIFGSHGKWGIYSSEGLNINIVGVRDHSLFDSFQQIFSIDGNGLNQIKDLLYDDPLISEEVRHEFI
ncbi:hypothetical protein L0244_24675, partial [bacterium]|nr:hypothetical protein [bacterium]